MADDPTGRPKPPARRRRQVRATRPATAAEASGTIEPTAIEPDPSFVQAPTIEEVPTVEPVATEALETGSEAGGATAWPMLDGRSPNDRVCPFLRSVDDGDRLDQPLESPDTANRCAALDDAVPQSLRQQELVCLTTSHVNCPRYLRGAVVAVDPASTRTRSTPTMTPAMLGSMALLAAAFTASVVFTLARGGLDLPTAAGPGSPGPSSSAIAVVPSASPSAVVSLAPSAAPTPSVAPSVSASPSVAPTPSPTAAPTPSAAPTAFATPTPVPTSGRYALLTACPNKPDCWLYRIRPGDNLFSIAKYFGIPLATVKSLNPWTASGLKVGRQLVLPPPTR